jgi:catechol 2,3-dioxygenase-like lactoylglutathione lyase family enzyme
MAFEARVGTDHHTAMRVRDLEKVLTFYQDVVGLKELRRQGDPARPTGVFLPAIQLVRAESQDVAEKGVLDHVGLIVQNLDEIVANLEKNGVELEGPVNQIKRPDGSIGAKTAFFRDVEGNRIELVERAG